MSEAGSSLPGSPPVGEQPGATAFRLGHQPALDGIRAVGVTTFIVYHGQLLWHAGRGGTEGDVVLFPGAFLWLDMFFVLSAFLITTLLIQEWRGQRRISIGSFWMRRAYRLFPALAAVGLFVAFWLVTFAPKGPWRTESWQEWWATMLYVNNWWHVFNPEALPHYLSHAWSLSMEEQFYLFAPLIALFALQMRWSARVAAFAMLGLAAASAAWMISLADRGATVNRLYYSTDTRAQAFFLGVALAFAVSGGLGMTARSRAWLRFAPWLALPVVVLMLQTARLDSHSRGTYEGALTVACVTWTAIILTLVAVPNGWLGRTLGLRPLRYAGKITYGLYLWHWPIMLVTFQYLEDWPMWPLIGLQTVLTFIVAALSWRFLEAPFIARSPRYRVAPAPAPAA